jgi:hypothetical protein
MLNKSGESWHPCLIPNFRENGFSFFPIQHNVDCRFVIYNLYYVRYDSSVPRFFRAFIMRGCWVLSKTLSASIDDQLFLSLFSTYVLYFVYWFVYFDSFLHPWNETNFIIVSDLVEFGLQVFYWELLYLCPSGILVYSCILFYLFFIPSWITVIWPWELVLIFAKYSKEIITSTLLVIMDLLMLFTSSWYKFW